MEDKKEYSMVGKVEIGTDEYRDLIESLAEAKADYSNASRKNNEYYLEVDKLKKQVEELKVYREFVNEKCLDSYKLWKIEKEERNCDD